MTPRTEFVHESFESFERFIGKCFATCLMGIVFAAIFLTLVSVPVYGQQSKVAVISSHMTIIDGDTVRNEFKAVASKSGVFDERVLNTRMSKKSASYALETGGDYIRFYYRGGSVPADKFIQTNKGRSEWLYGKARLVIHHNESSIKEDVIIDDGGELNHSWLIASNLKRHDSGFGKYKILEPFATDAGGDTLELTSSIAWKDTAWWMNVAIEGKGAKYPITLDPTAIDTTISAESIGSLTSADDATYLTTRNSITGATSSQLHVGQRLSLGKYAVKRGFLRFNYTLPSNAVFDSAKLSLDGGGDQSNGVDFNVTIVSSRHNTPIPVAGDFDSFIGWAAAGAYAGMTPISKAWSSTEYSADWNNIYFTPAGLDTLKARMADTLRIAFISSLDSSATAPADNEYIDFSGPGEAAATRPRLIIYYLLPNIYAADSLAFSSLTDSSAVLDSIACNPLDESNTNFFSIYDTSMSMYLDTSLISPFTITEKKYTKLIWNDGRWYPFPRNYTSIFRIFSYALNKTDSLKIKIDSLTIGTPTGGGDGGGGTNQGRWNPADDKIE